MRLLNDLREEDDKIHSYKIIDADSKEHPDRYEIDHLPPLLYSKDDIDTYPDSPMHLIPGIFKESIYISIKPLKAKSKWENFFISNRYENGRD